MNIKFDCLLTLPNFMTEGFFVIKSYISDKNVLRKY